MFYIFSDGFQDQFGGVSGRKMTGKVFRKLLQEISHLPLEQQRVYLGEFFCNWMDDGGESQLDDVMVLGFRLGS